MYVCLCICHYVCVHVNVGAPMHTQAYTHGYIYTCSVFILMCRYHHNAYFMQQTGVVIRNMEAAMSSDFVDYMEMVFSNQESKLLYCISKIFLVYKGNNRISDKLNWFNWRLTTISIYTYIKIWYG